VKSYGTLGHSRAVAELAEAAGWRLGFDPDAISDLRCAAWLHDLARVGVSTAVWEMPGPFTSGEWEQVRLHSYNSERLPARIPSLDRRSEFARTRSYSATGSSNGRCGWRRTVGDLAAGRCDGASSASHWSPGA